MYMQFTCQYNSVKYDGFKSLNYIENTLTKKSFSETWYDSYNNYIEKEDILIVTANSTVTVNVSLSFHKIHGLNK